MTTIASREIVVPGEQHLSLELVQQLAVRLHAGRNFAFDLLPFPSEFEKRVQVRSQAGDMAVAIDRLFQTLAILITFWLFSGLFQKAGSLSWSVRLCSEFCLAARQR